LKYKPQLNYSWNDLGQLKKLKNHDWGIAPVILTVGGGLESVTGTFCCNESITFLPTLININHPQKEGAEYPSMNIGQSINTLLAERQDLQSKQERERHVVIVAGGSDNRTGDERANKC
jgi:hypothetical protein